MKQLKTLKVRVKDKHVPPLNIMASNVNFVWNYINELSHKSIKDKYRCGTQQRKQLRNFPFQAKQ